MRWTVTIEGNSHHVELERDRTRWLCRFDGVPLEANVIEIAPGHYSILLGHRSFDVWVDASAPDACEATVGSRRVAVSFANLRPRGRRSVSAAQSGLQPVAAPMPGKVVRVLVEPGAAVEAGQGLLVLEAMKMQNELRAPRAGRVHQLLVSPGQAVNAGDILVVVG